ncbi:MAG: SufE family protein [Caldilineales bacterium]|nr:SufE family protein [Caldilineales bacterium]
MFDDPNLAEKWQACPPALQEIIAEFQEAPPSVRIEYMVDFAETLPDLPARLADKRDQMEQVHECQSPVFLHTEVEDGVVHFYFDIPREAPTVRGYASILSEGLEGASPEQVLATPDDVYRLLGLHEAISHLRLRGLHSLLVYMKRQTVVVSQAVGNNDR